jgi:hypothetical protein
MSIDPITLGLSCQVCIDLCSHVLIYLVSCSRVFLREQMGGFHDLSQQSLFTKTWIVCHKIYVRTFTNNFWLIHISHRCHTEIHVALKYTNHDVTTLLTNCNWEHMANGADNWSLLLTNRRQTLTRELHCWPWNIKPSSGPQVNYFLSFQTLSQIKHADSSAEFICALVTSSPPVAVKHRTVNSSKKLRNSL